MPVIKASIFLIAFTLISTSAFADCSITFDGNSLSSVSDCAPKDIIDYLDNELACGHWAGEYPSDATAEDDEMSKQAILYRQKEIRKNLKELRCNRLACDRKNIMKKYSTRKDLLQATEYFLNEYVYVDSRWKTEICNRKGK